MDPLLRSEDADEGALGVRRIGLHRAGHGAQVIEGDGDRHPGHVAAAGQSAVGVGIELEELVVELAADELELDGAHAGPGQDVRADEPAAGEGVRDREVETAEHRAVVAVRSALVEYAVHPDLVGIEEARRGGAGDSAEAELHAGHVGGGVSEVSHPPEARAGDVVVAVRADGLDQHPGRRDDRELIAGAEAQAVGMGRVDHDHLEREVQHCRRRREGDRHPAGGHGRGEVAVQDVGARIGDVDVGDLPVGGGDPRRHRGGEVEQDLVGHAGRGGGSVVQGGDVVEGDLGLDRPDEAVVAAIVDGQARAVVVHLPLGLGDRDPRDGDRGDGRRGSHRLEEADGDVARSAVGLEAEAEHRAPAQGIGIGIRGVVLVHHPRDAVGRDRAHPVGAVRGFAAVVIHVVEAHVGHRGAGGKCDVQRPGGAVGVHVVEGDLVAVGATGLGVGAKPEDHAAVAGDVDVLEVDAGIDAGPAFDGRLLADGGSLKAQAVVARAAGDGGLAPGGVVVVMPGHGVVGGDVVTLGEVARVRVHALVEVVLVDLEPAPDGRGDRRRGEGVGEVPRRGIDLEAGAEAALGPVETRAVGVGAADAEARAATGIRGAGAAEALLQGGESVLEPGHPDLLETPVLAEAVEVLGDHRVLVVARDPVQNRVTDVAGGGPDREGGDLARAAVARRAGQVAHDHVRPLSEGGEGEKGEGEEQEGGAVGQSH